MPLISTELQLIEESTHWQQADMLGPDPFGLRATQPAKAPLPIEEVMTKYSLTGVPPKSHIEIYPKDTDDTPLLPNIVQAIWFGSTNVHGQNNIKSFVKHNPDKYIILWTDQLNLASRGHLYETDAGCKALIDWCQQHNIVLLSVDDVLLPTMDQATQAIFLRERLRSNHGAESDVARLQALKNWGGVYTDIDIQCLKPIPKTRLEKGIRLNAASRVINGSEIDEITNDLIYTLPNHPQLSASQKKIIDRYQMSLENLFQTFEQGFINTTVLWFQRFVSYVENIGSLAFIEVLRTTVIYRTGPSLFQNYFGENIAADLTINPEFFLFSAEGTWLRAENRQIKLLDHLTALKTILTNILADLRDEPRVLFLDDYATTINQTDTVSDVFYLITPVRGLIF